MFLAALLGLSIGALAAQEPQSSPAPRPIAHAVWVDADKLVIDGNASEWCPAGPPLVAIERLEQFIELAGRPARDLWSSPGDASLRVWLGWTKTDLVIAGEVHDEVADYDPSMWFQGDSLELFVDVADCVPTWGADDFQMMLAPDWADRPWGVYPRAQQALGSARASDGGFGGVEVASVPFIGGYRFEARVPWRNFASFVPSAGADVGLNFAICDRDGHGTLESYGTWTGEREIAQYADRRGHLVLDAPADRSRAAATGSAAEPSFGARSLLLVGLAVMYALALWTRRAWRSARARKGAIVAASCLLAGTGLIAVVARWIQQSRASEERVALERYWTRFERLVSSHALGYPERAEFLVLAQSLLANQAIAPVPPTRLERLAPANAVLGPLHTTARRGIPYAPIVLDDQAADGVVLAPGDALTLPLNAPLSIDAVHLVTRISDRRYLRVGSEQVRVLAIEAYRDGKALPVTRDVRHRQDLHFEEDEHADHPGLEPAFYAAGGRLGRVHGDGLLVDLGGAHEVDSIVVRNVAAASGYQVTVVAVGARTRVDAADLPAGIRATAEGAWQWTGARSAIEAEVAAPGRSAKKTVAGQIEHQLVLGEEALGTVFLRSAAPPPSASRWDFLPPAALVGIAPFLVALFAEWLASRRRMRGKLAVGFAVSSAVPLLALTLLLDASLRAEHEHREDERARTDLVRAEQEIEREVADLERDAQRFLRISELQRRVRGGFPETSDELNQWWGDGEGALRLLERTSGDGRRVRVGSGPGWRQIPRGMALRSGLERPWGQLLVCGVAQTPTGAEQPLTVTVARAPNFADSTGEPVTSALSGKSASVVPDVRLIGAGRDPAPSPADPTSGDAREIRRPVYAPGGEELAGVLVTVRRERGVPVLGDYTLTELLLAAGITALFTALLFAGILTAHIVGPIERLDRAVRQGSPTEVRVEVDDEIGHLTSAIQAFSSEVAERVRQLETLQIAQGDLSRRLDSEHAREAILGFILRHSGAQRAWILWRGEAGEEPRACGVGGSDLALPDDAGLLQRALHCGEVQHCIDAPGLPSLSEFERVLLGPMVRVLCLPLIAAGDTRGAIVLAYDNDADRKDLAFLRAAASQAAIVLENARLYGQAVRDTVTGFLSDPGFRQRVAEEIQRAEAERGGGVLLLQLRLTGLPQDDERAAIRLREAARRTRLAMRGMAIFGRSGSADLKVALPWGQHGPNGEALARRLVDRVATGPWPDGEAVEGLLVAHASWPSDGPSARFVLSLLEERLAQAHTGVPAARLARLAPLIPVDFVARSPIMLQLLDTVRRIAQEEITVLVTGETGVGKDRLAELIHQWSPRAVGPLVHIHCPSLSTALIEDELFGHEKGAFTGAHTRRTGPFEFASGGTVVLDEVGGLSQAGQVALLRLLESREVLPLGATRPVPIDVRIIATSSRDLAVEVEQGRLRRDLFFRLNVAQVTVPPLRLRRQAIPELVDAFLRRFNTSATRPVTGVSPKVMDVLFDHDWPGNVRELENVISRALVMAEGGELTPEQIDLEPVVDELGPAAGTVILTGRQEQLLEWLAPGDRISSTEYAERAEISGRTALRDLLDLTDLGFFTREGQRRGTRFRRTQRPFVQRSGR